MKVFIRFCRRWFLPLLLCVLLWVVISKGNLSSWVVGLPCIVIAVVAYQQLRVHGKPAIHVRLLPGFSIWFLWHSLRGGIDVAWRALQPKVQLQPGFLHYRLTLPPGPARLFLVNVVSLLPGTLSADIEGDVLLLHALDTSADITAEISEAESRITALYATSESSTHE